jgi:hypothetical protein
MTAPKKVNTLNSIIEGSPQPIIIKQKRGRKSKKELLLINEQKQLNNQKLDESVKTDTMNDNINCVIVDNNCYIENNDPSINVTQEIVYDNHLYGAINDVNNDADNDNNNYIINTDNIASPVKGAPKKRGRKPKGGKIIQQVTSSINNKETKANIILHLKCSLKELQSNQSNDAVDSFNLYSCKNEFNYEIINSSNNNLIQNNYINEDIVSCNADNSYEEDNYYEDNYDSKEFDIKDVWKKLKILEHNLHVNNISDKKSACFWCTFEFDNPPIYIPKHFLKESYNVYGCFCSPECATAYLMDENIDSSTKFERYHLINHIYSKIYNYTKNVKPAPNPFYMLDKYYGNLNIQEYRALLRNERLFLVVDKPLTRILPELHEDNDDFIINNKIIPSNAYQVKKKLQKKTQSKNNILNEKFGMAQ